MNLADKLDGLTRDIQILYNRVVSLLGMSLFRRGRFNECYSLIAPLMSAVNSDGRVLFKDLIGQINSDPAAQKLSPME